MVVFSSTVNQHLQRLDLVLDRLQQQGLKVKLEKCCFFRKEVKYLGHVISQAGVSTDPEKISAVANWGRPKHVSELRSQACKEVRSAFECDGKAVIAFCLTSPNVRPSPGSCSRTSGKGVPEKASKIAIVSSCR